MMNCEEIKEAARAGETIPEAALEHALACPGCSETISKEKRLSGLVRGLPRLSPPPSFDNVLRERIESRKAGRSGSLLRPGFLVPAAASLVIALVAIFGFYSLYRDSDSVGRLEVPEPAEPSRTEIVGDDDGQQVPANEPAEEPSEEPGVPPLPPAGSKRPVQVKRPVSDPGGGSIDLAASEPERILPPWMKRGAPDGNTPNRAEQSFGPAEILGELGIDAVFAEGAWKVRSLKPKSIGSRSGLRVGDVIRAIDGTELGTEPVTGGAISGTSLTVLRDGRTITVPITP